ncbi:MAG TPA: UDP-N-acetylmuramate dehydrogenase [Candidatus Omnitrophica bacterium]|nr:UDP-N-acetylmuramate dehydrogenase [Candidatus Omnitrophota bacterium]
MNYLSRLSGKIKFDESLKSRSTFKIGGRARIWFEPDSINDLCSAVKVARDKKIPVLIIGAGSNILVAKKKINVMVINLNAKEFKRIEFGKQIVDCGAGVKLSFLIKKAASCDLGGLEFLSGIPATVGGALSMNAGISFKIPAAPGERKSNKLRLANIANLLEDITVMTYRGIIRRINKKDLIFGYRRSNLSKYIILSARFKLIKKTKKQIKEDIKEYLVYRRRTQDLRFASLGCIFKNPKSNISAGRLIDLCGLKGKMIGDACISEKHANFILNKGNAKAGDVLRLIRFIKKKVRNKFNIVLTPEIKIWN